jgi:hypothetical protein
MDKLGDIKVLSLSERVTSTGVVTNGVTLRIVDGVKVRKEGRKEKDERAKRRRRGKRV